MFHIQKWNTMYFFLADLKLTKKNKKVTASNVTLLSNNSPRTQD